MEVPLVSVIVPVYNAEKYIAECIKSVFRQSYKNWELILVDDCSSDGSIEICEEYAEKEDRVKLLKQTSQGGVSKARNCGLVNSKGGLVCFIDADDFIDDDYIDKLSSATQRYEVPVVFGRHKYYQDGKYISRPIRISEGLYGTQETSDRLIDDGTLTGILFGSVCGAIYDADFIRSHNIAFDETLVRNEDGVFNLALLSQSEKYYVIDYDGYSYRQWKGQKCYPAFEPDIGLKNSTDVIKKQFVSFDDFEVQLQRRAVSVIFWNAIRIGQCDGGFAMNCRRLKRYITQSTLDSGYQSLRLDEIGKYKRILIGLLKRNHIMAFCLLMKYVYPMMQGLR